MSLPSVCWLQGEKYQLIFLDVITFTSAIPLWVAGSPRSLPPHLILDRRVVQAVLTWSLSLMSQEAQSQESISAPVSPFPHPLTPTLVFCQYQLWFSTVHYEKFTFSSQQKEKEEFVFSQILRTIFKTRPIRDGQCCADKAQSLQLRGSRPLQQGVCLFACCVLGQLRGKEILLAFPQTLRSII